MLSLQQAQDFGTLIFFIIIQNKIILYNVVS